MTNILPYAALCLLSVFLGSISQVMLKKEAIKPHDHWLKEYLNPLVITAYIIFVATTVINIFVYKGLPLNLGPVLETTGYIYITIFGALLFKEKLTAKKALALAVIICGIIIYSFG